MKLAIIIIAMWCVVLEFWVWNAEQKDKVIKEERKRELERKAREREAWVKQYRR